jgi:transcriptional regulator with XRE-family HTH domain
VEHYGAGEHPRGAPAKDYRMTMTLENETERVTRIGVGQRVREWRLRREMSQADVARLTGITQASLSNYENGKRDMPLSTLLGVSAALNVSLGDLLDLPEVIVVRDSTLGRAVEQLQTRGALATGAAEAAL